jgi:hypothetical protein
MTRGLRVRQDAVVEERFLAALGMTVFLGGSHNERVKRPAADGGRYKEAMHRAAMVALRIEEETP